MRTDRSVRPPARSPTAGAFFVLLAVVLGGCENVQLAPGDVNDIYVAAAPELWAEVQDTVDAALQPTVLTVTDEMAFQVVHADPTDPRWERIRTFKQILLVGTRDDPWVATALERADRETLDPPEILRLSDVWSMNQNVTVLLLDEGRPAEVAAHLPELHRLYETMFRQWALERMFVSGRDSALADTLAREAGFSLLLPDVYDWDHRDSLYIFRNDNPSPDELIRQVMVTWRSPIPAELGQALERSALLDWREEAIHQALTIPQEVDTSLVRAGEIDYQGRRAFELQAIWQNPPAADWPAAGPFVTRLIECPAQDRLYMVDAWLYAPGRDKYEYMIQLQTIMDSFRCGG